MNGSAPEVIDMELRDGSACELTRPSAWNGYLVSQPDLWRNEIDEKFQTWLAAQGFASVRHTRDVRGWDLARGIANHHEATDAFIDRFGAPERGNIAMGGSMGGLLTRLLVENDPDAFVGALPTDGGGAGMLATFNRGLDMAFVVSQLLAGDDPIALTGAASIDDEVARLSAVIAAARWEPTGLARLVLAAAIGSVPVWSDPLRTEPRSDSPADEADHQVAGMASTIAPAYYFRGAVEALVGGVVVDNSDVDYAQSLAVSGAGSRVQALYDDAGLELADDLRLLAAAPRVTSSPQAVEAATSGVDVTGRVHCPVFVLKSLSDPDASVAEEHAYLAAAARAGRRELVRVGFIRSAGHLNSTLAERAAALSALVDRIETGTWHGLTSPRALNERARRIALDDRWDFSIRLTGGPSPEIARFVSYDPWPYPRARG